LSKLFYPSTESTMLTSLFAMTPRPMIWLTLSREIELTSLASTYSTKLVYVILYLDLPWLFVTLFRFFF
jgi:hypothetical protein